MDNSAGRYGGRSPRKQPPLTAVASTAAVAGTAAFLALLVLGALPAQRDTNHTGNPPHLTVKSSTPNVSALAADAGRGTRRGRAGSDGEPTGIPGTAGNPTGPAAGACDDWAPIRDFNAETVNGPVQALVKRPFFRYYRVQLENECPCWTDNDGMCMTEDCEVTECDEPRLRNSLLATTPFNQVRQGQCEPQPPLEGLHPRGAACPTEVSIDLAPARTLTGADPGEEYPEAIVCLPDNPERFTGYSGRSAHRVWGGVQAECDALGGTAASPVLHDAMERLMSGFHASVSTHLCRLWPDEETGDFHPNADEFWRRFSADATGGCGPRWLGNLHFLFRTVLEAVARAQPVWERYPFASSDPAADDETRRMAAQLSASARRFIEARSAAAGGEERGGWPLTALLQTEGADSFMCVCGRSTSRAQGRGAKEHSIAASLPALSLTPSLPRPLPTPQAMLRQHPREDGLRRLHKVPAVGETASARHRCRPEHSACRDEGWWRTRRRPWPERRGGPV